MLCVRIQVYKGRLRATGQVVAVKVQRPGVRESIALDIYIMRFLLQQVRKLRKVWADAWDLKSRNNTLLSGLCYVAIHEPSRCEQSYASGSACLLLQTCSPDSCVTPGGRGTSSSA